MRPLAPVAVPALAATLLAGCAGHRAALPAVTATRSTAAARSSRPPAERRDPCTAAGLTGRLGVIGLGAGQYTRQLVLTNTSARPCTLTGGPREIVGVRAGGQRVRLAAGASRGASRPDGRIGPVTLMPGQSAQVVLRTNDVCPAAADRTDGFAALEIGIPGSGDVLIAFPRGQPYRAVCGIGVSAFGAGKARTRR